MESTIKSIEPQKLYHCRMCKKPVWVPAKQDVHVLGLICSEKCEADYDELRRDGHWR